MQKKLVVVGHSLALVIDKPVRHLLGIGRNTLLRVSTNGRMLVVEPIGEDTPDRRRDAGGAMGVTDAPSETGPFTAAQELDARRETRALFDLYGMSQAQLQELHHNKRTRVGGWLGWLMLLAGRRPDEAERMTLKRVRHCLDRLQAGDGWDHAIAAALAAVPITPAVASPVAVPAAAPDQSSSSS
jgi:hypothetical protein